MGISFDQAFGAPPAPIAKPAAKPPTATPAQDKPTMPQAPQGGLSFDQAFGPAPPTTMQKVEGKVESAAKTVEAKVSPLVRKMNAFGIKLAQEHPNLAAGPEAGFDANYKKTAVAYTNQAIAELEKEINKPTGDVLQGPKVVIDALNAMWQPLQAGIDVRVIEPIQAELDKLASLTTKWDEYSPKDRRLAWDAGHPIPFKNELQGALKNLKTLVAPVVNTGTMFIGGEGALAHDALAAEDLAKIRNSVEELHGPMEPPPAPTHTAALDHTMGFQAIRDHIPDVIASKADGHVGWAKDVLSQMLPHAQGYAKNLLQKIIQHMDENVAIRFKMPENADDKRFGFYIPEYHGAGMQKPAITIFTNRPDSIHTIIHESVHAVTVRIMDQLLKNDLDAEKARLGRSLTEEEKLKIATHPKNSMLKEIDQILAETRARAAKAGNKGILDLYGLNGDRPIWDKIMLGKHNAHWTDPAYIKQVRRYEFIAEVMTNPELQEFMANSERYASKGYKFKNMLNQLGLLIGKHLGIKNPHTLQLLNQSMRVGDQLMRMQFEAGGKGKLARSFNDAILGRLPDGEVITKSQVDSATALEPPTLSMQGPPIDFGSKLVEQGSKLKQQIADLQDKMNEALKQQETHPETSALRFRALRDQQTELRRKLAQVQRQSESIGAQTRKMSPDALRWKKEENLAWEEYKKSDFKDEKAFRRFKKAQMFRQHYEDAPPREIGQEGRPPTEIARTSAKQARKQAENTIRLSIEGLLRGIHPEGLGAKAKTSAAAIASRLAEHAQSVAMWRFGSKTRANFWRANQHLVKDFIRKFEKGEDFDDPILRKFAAKYRDWNKRIIEQDLRNGIIYEARDNYLSHLFVDQEGVADYFNQKYHSKWGDPSFTKTRVFDLYDQAIAAGFTPKFDNPEDIMLARQQASDLANMNIGILNDLASYGLAVRKIKGGSRLLKNIDADGKVTMTFDKVEGNKQPEDTTRWRAPNGEVFWVDNQAHAVLENAFKSKSLWTNKTIAGAGFRGMMTAKNLIVPIRLSMSLFHPLHIVGIDIAASMVRQLSPMLTGDKGVVEGLGGLLKSGFDPFYHNPKLGWKVLRAFRGQIEKSELNAADTEALQTIIDGGLILDMSAQYRTNARQNFMNALLDAHSSYRMGKPGQLAWGVTRATWHAPWALLSAAQAPIFEHWIPMLKGASYLQDAQLLLERNPELAENPAARKVALRKLAKSAENRYGEMAYNTLFWKRWIKDLAVMNTLSLGWQMGFLREYGGGAMDLGQFARGGVEGRLKMVKKGLLDRPLFVASYTTLGAGLMGLMTYGMTGTAPDSLLDYIDPRVGGTNEDGSPKRVSTMFYSREFLAIYKHMQDQGIVGGLANLAANKSSGLFGLMHEFYTGVNAFGEDIRDPNADLFTKTEQTLAYVLADMEPISLSSLNVHASTGTEKDKVLAGLGFTPAPKYVTETQAEALISQAYDKYVAPTETSFDRAEYSAEFRKLKQYYESGDGRYGQVLDSMVQKYQMGNKDIRRLIRTLNLNLPGSVKMFIQLPWQQQKVILDKLPAKERDQYLLYANKEHLRYSYQPPEDQQ